MFKLQNILGVIVLMGVFSLTLSLNIVTGSSPVMADSLPLFSVDQRICATGIPAKVVRVHIGEGRPTYDVHLQTIDRPFRVGEGLIKACDG